MRAGFFVRRRMAASRAKRSYQKFNFPDRMAGCWIVPATASEPAVEGAAGDRIATARYTVRPEAVETVLTPPEQVEYDAPMFGQPARAVPQYAPYPNTRRKIPVDHHCRVGRSAGAGGGGIAISGSEVACGAVVAGRDRARWTIADQLEPRFAEYRGRHGWDLGHRRRRREAQHSAEPQ